MEDETLSVTEAAQRSGTSEETVRRAVRKGEVPDLRENGRGIIRVRVQDVDYLKGKARSGPKADTLKGYDPVRHAQRLLRAG